MPITSEPDLASVDQTVHPNDNMGARNLHRYLVSGGEAARLTLQALQLCRSQQPSKVLDFACGFGRVARHLRSIYPQAELVGADVWTEAAEFCSRFADRTVHVGADGQRWDELGDGFDLIWCGSLLTHLPEDRARRTLQLFQERLAPGGLAVFTTHGRFVCARLGAQQDFYGVSDRATLETAFERGEHGFVPYAGQTEYGMSVTPPTKVLDWVLSSPDLTLRLLTERGWDDHQDVVVVQRRPVDAAWVNLADQAPSESER